MVSRGTNSCNSIETKDYLVTQESFVIEEKEKGISFTRPVIADEEIDKYYNTTDYLSHSSNKTLMSFFFNLFSKIMVKKKTSFMLGLGGASAYLDYGCGVGKLISSMNKKGVASYGYDTSLLAISICNNKSLNASSNLDDLPNQYNLISFWHSLEHVSDHTKVLKKTKKMLSKNGTMVVALPNYDSFDAKFYSKFWAAYDTPRHRVHFTKKGFIKVASQLGFEVVKTKPLFLDSFYISMMSEKYKQSLFYFLKGLFIGALSNLCFLFTKQASSHVYVLKNLK
jgi:2-polyprenyl-3-methyl-5-hydroxy-6-metoxy-1,4-benzoquinol methylase